MRFSKRTDWELSSNQIAQALEGVKAAGHVVLDLTESNPTCCGFEYPSSQVLSCLSAAANMQYQPCPQGNLRARQAVCDHYSRQGIFIQPQNVFLTASTSESYSFLFRLLADPGDDILFPQPSYPLFQFLVDLNDLVLKNYRLVYENRWQVDLDSLAQAFTKSTRAVVLVNPNNPTGSSFSASDQQEISRLCRDHDVPIISDEVFLEYPFAEHGAIRSFLHCPDNLVFVLGGLSKTMALPQMKVGWIVLNGPADQVEAAQSRLEVIADTYLSVNTPAQNALGTWLDLQPMMQAEVLGRVRKNRAYAVTCAAAVTGCECLAADGGWSVVLRLPTGVDEENFVLRLLTLDQVFVHPGYFFDFETEPFLVLSLLVPPDIFRKGLDRILARVQTQCC